MTNQTAWPPSGTVPDPSREPSLAVRFRVDGFVRVLTILVWSFAAFAVVIVCVGKTLRLHYNMTASAGPVGLYEEADGAPARGDLVIACLPWSQGEPALARGYLQRGMVCPGPMPGTMGVEPVIKLIAGMPGDLITLTPADVRAVDSKGRPLAHYQFGTFRLLPDQVWLRGNVDRSWDSRYFGPVPLSNVIARVRPVLGEK